MDLNNLGHLIALPKDQEQIFDLGCQTILVEAVRLQHVTVYRKFHDYFESRYTIRSCFLTILSSNVIRFKDWPPHFLKREFPKLPARTFNTNIIECDPSLHQLRNKLYTVRLRITFVDQAVIAMSYFKLHFVLLKNAVLLSIIMDQRWVDMDCYRAMCIKHA
jgi:hypothetical protein